MGCIRSQTRWTVFSAAALALLVALSLAACGGSSASSPSSVSKKGLTALTGKQVFETAGCAGCHTLAAVGASGSIGPDLDKLKPTFATVEKQVTHGGGVMPSFAGKLSQAEIAAVAKFVSSATR
jgi:mono/diheme cytochrome c family protein